MSESVVHNHNTLNNFLEQRRKKVLTDFDIIYGEHVFPCHRAIAVLSSKKIATCVHSGQTSLYVDEDVETTTEVMEGLVNSFYGESFQITPENVIDVYEIAKYLGMSELQSLSKSFPKTPHKNIYVRSLNSVLSDIHNDQYQDFSIIYKNVRLTMHKFLLVTLCPHILTKLHLDPEDNQCDFTKFLTVEESSLEQFFTSFYEDNITITLENLFDISHLSFYLQVETLKTSCDSFRDQACPSVDWIFPALLAADKADDLVFASGMAPVLARVNNLSQSDPIAVQPDILYSLCPNVNVSWLSTVLVHSYFYYYSANNQRVWTPNNIQKALNQIDTKTLTIEQLYSIIKPLLEAEELYSVLSDFSLTRFTIEKSEIPSEWLVWLMVELDKNEPTNELNLTTRFASLLSKVFSKAKLSLIEPLVLHPKSFNVYLSNITEQYLILWFIRSLIISWKVKNHWTVEIFTIILHNINLKQVDPREMIFVLQPLIEKSELHALYCSFVSMKIAPLLIRDYATTTTILQETSKKLSQKSIEVEVKTKEHQQLHNTLMDQLQSLRTSNDELSRKLETETKKNVENQKTISNLQSENNRINAKLSKHATYIQQKEEEELNKFRRRVAVRSPHDVLNPW
ncbi:hypothetical protein RCL1_003953 [Eukaryota sp. TZLM3-RCL]